MHIRRQLQYGQLTDSEKWLIENYRSIVGKIGWPAKCVRPDLSQTFSMLSRALADPQPCDARTLRKALQYIYHHQDEPMEMKRPSWFVAGKTPLELLGFSDSNYADQFDKEFRATTGFCYIPHTLRILVYTPRNPV